MFKRSVVILTTLVFILSLSVHAFATQSTESSSVIYLENGDYITISVQQVKGRASGTTSGHKDMTYTASSGTVCWKATLYGTFSYTGTTATCTAASCSVIVYESNWYTVSKSATKSGNTATATVTMGRKVLGITIDKDTYTTTLSCDKNGNLS